MPEHIPSHGAAAAPGDDGEVRGDPRVIQEGQEVGMAVLAIELAAQRGLLLLLVNARVAARTSRRTTRAPLSARKPFSRVKSALVSVVICHQFFGPTPAPGLNFFVQSAMPYRHVKLISGSWLGITVQHRKRYSSPSFQLSSSPLWFTMTMKTLLRAANATAPPAGTPSGASASGLKKRWTGPLDATQ